MNGWFRRKRKFSYQPWKNITGFLISAGCGLIGLLAYLPYAGNSPSVCAFHDTVYDFGQVALSDRLYHRFPFQNRGLAPIRIRRVVTGCGCVVHTLEKKFYRPGEAGSLSISLNTDGFKAPQNIEHSIWLEYSYLGKVASERLRVRAELAPDIECTPTEIHLVRDPLTGKLGSRLTIRRRQLGLAAFRQLRVEGPSSRLTLQELSRECDAVVIGIRADSGTGHAQETVILRYRRAGRERVHRVRIRQPANTELVSLRPSSFVAIGHLQRGSVGLAATASRAFQLTSLKACVLKITAIEISGNPVQGMLAWRVATDAPFRFNLWIKKFPRQKVLMHTELKITYLDASTGDTGTCVLPVYACSLPVNNPLGIKFADKSW